MAFASESGLPANDRLVKISIRNVFKVFSDRPDAALDLKSGRNRTDIPAATGCALENAAFGLEVGEAGRKQRARAALHSVAP